MILKIFRTNQPAILLTLPIVAAVCWMPHFFSDAPAFLRSGLLLKLIPEDLEINPLVFKISAFTIITLQGLLFNYLLNQTEVFSRISYLPSLIFIIAGTILSYNGGWDAWIFCNLFLLLAIWNTLQVYHQNSAIGITFNIGFWIGMAALFEPLAWMAVIPAIIAVLILRAADWRELFFLLIGASLPMVFLYIVFFIVDAEFHFPFSQFKLNNNFRLNDSPRFIAFLIVAVLIVLQSFYTYWISLRGIILRVRKMRMVLFYFSLMVILVYAFVLFGTTDQAQHQILVIPMSLMVSFRMIQPARPLLADFTFYLMLALWGIFVYNLYFQ